MTSVVSKLILNHSDNNNNLILLSTKISQKTSFSHKIYKKKIDSRMYNNYIISNKHTKKFTKQTIYKKSIYNND